MKGTERPNILFTHAPYIDHLPRREKSIAAAPGEGGYATWHVGKWHLGPRKYYPDRHGEGVGLMPFSAAETSLDRDALFWHYPHYGNQGGTPASSLRRGDYKLIEFFEDGRVELYNLVEDPGEQHDLAALDTALVASLRHRLAQWRESVHALIPKRNPAWRSAPLPPRQDGA